MVSLLPQPSTADAATRVVTDTWVRATWEDFKAITTAPEAARFYYDSGWMRIETMPIGSAYAQVNSLLSAVITLYGTLKQIEHVALTNGSFQGVGERECQPDLAYYIGPGVERPIQDNQAVDINRWGPPTLAIEVAATTLNDDLGQKRLLYERLGVQEYWVVDVKALTVIAFEIISPERFPTQPAAASAGSRQIQVSSVLPGLAMGVIEAALHRSQTENDYAVNRWLMEQFQGG